MKDEEARAADLNGLLNLGVPTCRQWLTDHVCTLIRQHGIGMYRQDFNFPRSLTGATTMRRSARG